MSSRDKIRVSIVEDDALYAEMLKELVLRTEGLEFVAYYPTGEKALQELPLRQPDVVLVDLGLPGLGGQELIGQLAQKIPTVAFLVVSSQLDDEAIFTALRLGAVGYLLKGASARELEEGILAAAAGGSPISPGIANRLVRHFQAPVPVPVPVEASVSLSLRERKVIDSFALGLRNKEVAAILEVSEHTVRTYVRRAFAKLQATSRAEAVAKLYKI